MRNNRVNADLRAAIDRYLSKGWVIVSRNPLRLQRGLTQMQVINEVINHG